MKKLPYIISGFGFAIFGVAGSCDFIEHPIIVIPIIIGVLLILAGYYIEKNWVFEDKVDFDSDGDSNDSDNGITYITFEGSRCAENVKRVKKQSVLKYLLEIGVDVHGPIYEGKERHYDKSRD